MKSICDVKALVLFGIVSKFPVYNSQEDSSHKLDKSPKQVISHEPDISPEFVLNYDQSNTESDTGLESETDDNSGNADDEILTEIYSILNDLEPRFVALGLTRTEMPQSCSQQPQAVVEITWSSTTGMSTTK
jgi:hypothetical protein